MTLTMQRLKSGGIRKDIDSPTTASCGVCNEDTGAVCNYARVEGKRCADRRKFVKASGIKLPAAVAIAQKSEIYTLMVATRKPIHMTTVMQAYLLQGQSSVKHHGAD